MLHSQSPLLVYHVEPAKGRGMDVSTVVPLLTVADVPVPTSEPRSHGGPPAAAAPAAAEECVVFLGTSAATPSKYRNGGACAVAWTC
jgi:hypothetical protein